MGEVADKAGKVLVGRVRGRTYSANRLGLWVKEIGGKIFIQLPEVQILPRDGLRSTSPLKNTQTWRLPGIGISKWPLCYSKDGALFSTQKENRSVSDPYGCDYLGYPFNTG